MTGLVLAKDPKYELALGDKGWALVDLGNYTQAITYFDKTLAIGWKSGWGFRF